MALRRIKLFFNRFLNALKIGFFFFGARYLKIPKNIKIRGKKINLNLPDEYGVKITFAEIFLDDTYELDWIKKFAEKKNIEIKSILDIGGNCGLTSLKLRSHFPKSIIHCYEPNLELQNYLETNSKSGNFNCYFEAIGSFSGYVKLNTNKNNSVLSSIQKDIAGETKQISIEDAFKRFNVDYLDIVKMDCEGSEWQIFENKNLFKKVKFITMEYHLEENNPDHYQILNVLDDLGFKLVSKIDYLSKANYGIALAYNRKIML